MDDELLDLVDKNDKVIGTVWMNEAHNNPKLIHREVGIAVFNNKGGVLLQQRSLNKRNGPGQWKVTAAGHPNAGEAPIEAIKRELNEELGIEVDPIFFKKIFSSHNKKGENTETRFTWLYYAILSRKSKVTLQESEVNDARWVRVKSLEDFSKKNDYDLKGVSHKIIIEIARILQIL